MVTYFNQIAKKYAFSKSLYYIQFTFSENVPAKLVNSGKITVGSEPFPEKVPDKIPEKRTSSGLGDSSVDSSNAELDALSKMVVDKVLEKIKNTSDGNFRGSMHTITLSTLFFYQEHLKFRNICIYYFKALPLCFWREGGKIR